MASLLLPLSVSAALVVHLSHGNSTSRKKVMLKKRSNKTRLMNDAELPPDKVTKG